MACGFSEADCQLFVLDVLLGESYAVCLKRFHFLLDGSAPLIAFNVSDFIVSNVFDSERRSSSLIVKRWLEQASRDGDDVAALLDAHLGLMYKLKKDLMLVDATVSFRFSTCTTSVTRCSDEKIDKFVATIIK